ncbi:MULTISPECIES: TonB-dependent receptor plug domain-containing protein [Hydrocarboniphaga]|uniref:TonB-dependent receptor plug domain-containing protein n=1 Tax=Hydrocarboniphaga TaxID=243627 RepID=UPI0002D51933|nr:MULTISPECIES: TonB-dependent receptor [Hydrocarboniphaga]MDZ4078548.1 TonB-dependent receptor [Hydrocarboniphaga sp.]
MRRVGSHQLGAFASALIAVFSSGAAQAQAAAAAGPSKTFTLGTVEVIGTAESDATALTTETVDVEQMLALHRDDLAEALDLVPGVALQNLGQRRERLIALRGFSSRQVPLFIDGVPVYVPYDGNVDLARFGIDYVSEIVVSKGLGSLLYGPNALGGAINVISRKPTAPLEIFARASAEFDDDFGDIEQRGSVSVGGARGAWYGNFTVSHADSEGYRLSDDFRRQGPLPLNASPSNHEDGGARDNADSRDTVISAKIGFVPNADNEFALSYYRQQGDKNDPLYSSNYLNQYACDADNDPSTPDTNCSRPDGVALRYWQWPYWNKESFYFVARNAVTSQGALRWRLFHDSFKNSLESFRNASYTYETGTLPGYVFYGSQYDDYTYGGGADFEWRWSDLHTTRIASHYRQDVHRESQRQPALPEQRLEIPTYDVAIEHEWKLTPQLTLTPGYSFLRQPGRTVQIYDSRSQTFNPQSVDDADAHNAQIIGTWRLDDSQSFVAGVSRKTRFPTLKDRFSGGLGTVRPNPALKREIADHYEIGYELRRERWGGRIALFQSELDDAIQSVTLLTPPAPAEPPCPNSTTTCTQLQNVGKQRHRGVELSATATPIDALTLIAQANFVDIDNRGQNSAVKITGTPDAIYRLRADWNLLPQWRLRLDAQHEADRFSNSTGTRVAESFTVANAFLRFSPVTSVGIDIGVRNLTDELYAYDEGYYEAGRTWLAQVDYRY